MLITTPGEADRVVTPNAAMTRIATPSLGTTELSTWTVRMETGAAGPVHAVDREQVWLIQAGEIRATVDGSVATIGRGQALVVPAGSERRLETAGEGPAEALVCMRAGGVASVPGEVQTRPIPWAE